MADAQAAVQAVLDELTAQDQERGLQVAAYLDGELVIDAWSGVADPATGRLVDGDTLFTVFSTTKGIVATVLHLLAERGLIDYDAPIARYWPEFGAHGKGAITVRHAASHTAGVPHLPEGAEAADMCDWTGITAGMADLAPLWEPGTRTGYHALSYGWLLGEVARRVDGRPVAQIVRDDVCAPLGIDDLFLGIPDEAESRIAPMEVDPHAGAVQPLPPDALILRAIPPSIQPLADLANRPDVRRASIPGGGGIMTARAVARHYAGLIGDVAGKPRLLSPERVQIATTLQTEETDLALGIAARKALGYWLGGPLSAMSERRTAFGHTGAGGSIGFADPEYRFSFGLAKNRMVTSLPGEGTVNRVAAVARAALGIPEGN